jgi:membrane-bound lytic murein transglycosylase D
MKKTFSILLSASLTALLLAQPALATTGRRSIQQDAKMQVEIESELDLLLSDSTKPENSEKPAPLEAQATLPKQLKRLKTLESSTVQLSDEGETPLIFDIPVTYNQRVQFWIKYFQGPGRSYFKKWLERSSRYTSVIQRELSGAGLPKDLFYLAMVESGFSPQATSNATAVGIWQFMSDTGHRYGLRTDWWLDERKDYYKSTHAAIDYMKDLYKLFGSWYLVAASYNMGETRTRKLIQRYHTSNFWQLADMGVLPDETRNYVPKIIAAMLIAKAPGLYGFRELEYNLPESFDTFHVPGGTNLRKLSQYLGVSEKHLRELNPELILGFVPHEIRGHEIRIPKGSMLTVSQYVRMGLSQTN